VRVIMIFIIITEYDKDIRSLDIIMADTIEQARMLRKGKDGVERYVEITTELFNALLGGDINCITKIV